MHTKLNFDTSMYKHTYMHIVVACCFCLSTASVWWYVCVRMTKKRKGTDHHVQERLRSEDKPHKQRQKCTQFIVLFICIKQQNNRIWAHLRRSFSLHHFNCARPHGLSFLSSNNRRHTKYIQLLKCFICSLFTYFVFFLPSDRDTSAYNFFFFRKESSPNLCIGSVSQT